MSQAQQPGFAIGDRAWFFDGRTMLIVRFEFNDLESQFQYFVDPWGGYFIEADLFDVNPVIDAPGPSPKPEPGMEPLSVAGVTIDEVREIVAGSVVGLLDTQRTLLAQLEQRTADNLATVTNAILEAMDSLESRVVTQQSDIDNRDITQDEAADESGDGGTLGLFRRIGGFVLNPFAAILSALEQYIIDEVFDGLTRRRNSSN